MMSAAQRQRLTAWLFSRSALKAVAPKVNTAWMPPARSPDGLSPDPAGNPALADAIAAAIGWWREAGVDGDWSDAPQDWLAAGRPAKPAASAPAASANAAVPPPEAPRPLAGGPAAWPQTLHDFAPWWMNEPMLAPPGQPRVAPGGGAGAALMIVVPMPAPDDHAGIPGGKGGVLVDALLRAAGIARDDVYFASAIPSRIAAPDWRALREAGLGDVLRHHVALVRPQRLLIFGQTGISTLLGHDSPNSHWHLPSINHGESTISALCAYDLDAIMARPALKAGLWRRWLDWMPA